MLQIAVVRRGVAVNVVFHSDTLVVGNSVALNLVFDSDTVFVGGAAVHVLFGLKTVVFVADSVGVNVVFAGDTAVVVVVGNGLQQTLYLV